MINTTIAVLNTKETISNRSVGRLGRRTVHEICNKLYLPLLI